MFLPLDKLLAPIVRIIVLVREQVVQPKELVLLVNTGVNRQGHAPLVQQDLIVGRMIQPLWAHQDSLKMAGL